MHLGVNLSLVFRDRTLLEAVEAAEAHGFRNIEFWWPSEAALAGATLDDVVRSIRERDLTVELLNAPAGDMAKGDRGLAGDPGRADEFRTGVERALALAGTLGCRKINTLAGRVGPDQALDAARAAAIANIAWAADRAAGDGISIVIEPVNAEENAGYLWPTVAEASDAIDAIDRDNVALLIDAYHIAMGGLDPAAAVAASAAPVGHVQLADSPGRHEPGTGGIAFEPLFDVLRPRYDGAVGLEFLPAEPGRPDFEGARRTLGAIGLA